ncbi:Taurine catabolism dioxygenase TauD TfdA family protein [Aspergillus parasiticus SU-1]|uniref:Taurine catabolism dioxygenase TauD TfdA family protein n=1 Tax=Aspergillus parasiticus (strain ATCC 56775 / NRRL 5862 / SRRC 143 / SU-1) TaxID=1403190 RepID=A0A0F0IIG8_ASPPU|nr:Taurine catabolism dioxygenase TauD TfdA family protein [Aspergillus parasiticus SU-1]
MTVPVASKPQSHVRIHSTGSLDGFKPTMLTPVIGNEFVKGTANIVDDILHAPNADQRIRDLAVMIAERGVVFFRAQNNLTNDLQKELITKMGKLTVRPPDHGLHTHPIYMSDREFSDRDAEISTIDSAALKKVWKGNSGTRAAVWHSDISFEPAPADFTSLRLTKLPETGGDTLWASGYEMYDRISKPYRTFLETLTATHVADGFHRASAAGKFDLYEKPRGSPLNVGVDLGAEHPIVRTNPITGWKSIYAVGFPVLKKVNGLTVRESENMFNYFHDLITYGHDLQVRFKWHEIGDIAIWDNRSTFHCATFDFDGFGDRTGNRAVGVGEVPCFDPTSKSRREDLGIEDTLPPFHW